MELHVAVMCVATSLIKAKFERASCRNVIESQRRLRVHVSVQPKVGPTSLSEIAIGTD